MNAWMFGSVAVFAFDLFVLLVLWKRTPDEIRSVLAALGDFVRELTRFRQ